MRQLATVVAAVATFLGVLAGLGGAQPARPGGGPGKALDEQRMQQTMKMMDDMQEQMKAMQEQMKGMQSMGPMHGRMGQMSGQMGQMHAMMQQHREQMQKLCPLGATRETPK